MASEPRDNRRPKLQARWYGDLPKVGEFLMSRLKPRAAYKITHVRCRCSEEPDHSGGEVARRLEITTEIVALPDVPKDAVIHDWKWDSRTKTGSAWR